MITKFAYRNLNLINITHFLMIAIMQSIILRIPLPFINAYITPSMGIKDFQEEFSVDSYIFMMLSLDVIVTALTLLACYIEDKMYIDEYCDISKGLNYIDSLSFVSNENRIDLLNPFLCSSKTLGLRE